MENTWYTQSINGGLILTPIMSVWSRVFLGTGWPSALTSAVSSGNQHGPSIVGMATNFDGGDASGDVTTVLDKLKFMMHR